MIHLKSQREVDCLRASGDLVSRTLAEVARYIEPGVTTLELDRVAEAYIRRHGAEPAFKGYRMGDVPPFPGTLCTSINDVVVHGIPDQTRLREGDLVSIDGGVYLDGYFGDSAYTFAVGDLSAADGALCRTTLEALLMGTEQAVGGARIGQISAVIQYHCERAGYGIVRELAGHGIGRKLHEAPQIPNYGHPGLGRRLRMGMTFCIEPMINRGTPRVTTDEDSWTVRTADGAPSAHFEHMIAVTGDEPEVLTTFDYIDEVFQSNSLLQMVPHG
ncbi:MAG: type I methionyl aminopeptidase [Bacteroidota bacterium]|nr:type I methionyl aminopeptidase [Bacteroidota bacterium]